MVWKLHSFFKTITSSDEDLFKVKQNNNRTEVHKVHKVQNLKFLWWLLVKLMLARLLYKLALLELNINILFWKEQFYPSF